MYKVLEKMRKNTTMRCEADKEYYKAKKIYEELLKEYPQDRRQIEMRWKETPTLQAMEILKEHEETFG